MPHFSEVASLCFFFHLSARPVHQVKGQFPPFCFFSLFIIIIIFILIIIVSFSFSLFHSHFYFKKIMLFIFILYVSILLFTLLTYFHH